MRRLRAFAVAALLLAALVAWALWPGDVGEAGPSLAERARQARAPAGAVSLRAISQDDLPPEGTRSLFDHLVAANEGLPYPFDKLVALLQAQDPDGRAPLALLIPEGRSLLKASAHYARPRVLVAADFQAPNVADTLGLAARGRLFLGFVEDAAEIEVISYNEAAGRYEFQLVQDYREDGVPRLVYARRAICMTCHQGAAPIFPQRPWSETNANPDVARRIAEAHGRQAYFGIPVATPLATPERFDELTDVANFVPVTQRIWLDGCGDGEGGRACRREMLRLALDFVVDPGGFDGGAVTDALRAMQAQHWPDDGIGVPDGDLRNRDPLAADKGLRAFLHDLLLPTPAPVSADDVAAFDRLPRLPAELDPVTPRPPRRVLSAAVVDGVFGLAQFFTAADADLIETLAPDRAGRARLVARLPDPLFDPAPFGRVTFLNALLTAARQPPRRYAFLDTSTMSPPQPAGVPPLALAEGSPLAPFAEYCFACHRGNPAQRLDFMSGADEATVLANLRARPEIRDSLDWARYRGTDKQALLMPPADSPQRAALERDLAGNPQLLDEMRKVVPAMFDF